MPKWRAPSEALASMGRPTNAFQFASLRLIWQASEMQPEIPAQVIFALAHELSGETRAAFVEQACGHDPELHREVLRLLEQA